MRLGFLCNWDPEPSRTWSHTPWSLRTALQAHTTVVDVGLQLRPWQRAGLKVAYMRRRQAQWTSAWKWSRLFDEVARVQATRRVSASGCDVVLQIQDLACLPAPYFVLQDLSIDVLIEEFEAGRAEHLGFDHMGVDLEALRRRRHHQLQVYEAAEGVIALSEWFAEHLVRHTGLPTNRVHVVHPGANVRAPSSLVDRTRRVRRRVLFVGRDFHRKGGPEVLEAVTLLRRHGRDVELTICGPRTWPLRAPPPAGVLFLGEVAPTALTGLYDSHDVFAMPSHFEAFGIAFVEALAHGLPCVGRRACAMPEIIEHGADGLLVDGNDPAELAVAINRGLTEPELHRTARDRATSRPAHYSWDRAASLVLRAIG